MACSSVDSEPSPEKTVSDSINTIMPLGASRVEGARPDYESYRYELWKDLIEDEWTFDFIGTMSDEANYPEYKSMSFDIDHEGRAGWTSGQILDGLTGWLNKTGAPDIVLFSSPGGNDALQGLPYNVAVDNVNEIIDIIQAFNPNVTIIIEQLAPARSDAMTPELTSFFNQMALDVVSVAESQTTSTSQIIPVDMFTGFTDEYFADEVHYNEAGASIIAECYYDILINVLQE